MIEKLVDWGGIIFAAIGIICLFLEAFTTFKRDRNHKLTIVGMIFLAASVMGFVVTELILRDKNVPIFLTVVWIVFLWVYIICNIVSAMLVSRKNKADKRTRQSVKEMDNDNADVSNTQSAAVNDDDNTDGATDFN